MPEFERNWIVRFNLPGRPVKAESSQVPVCSGCLAKRAAKEELSERCGRAAAPHVCRAAAMDWADAKLRVMSGLWQADRIAELEQVLNPKQAARMTVQTVV
ncbi:MAG: hypothetical protein EBR88_04450, partial [Betaproteobacteria bacterium]|nr:hypothetical protein [Betaproteobacteria bacterium]